MLTVRELSMRFGGLQALDKVSFTVNEGEIVGLIGPNGAGKTTVFNLISRLYEPTGGQIFFRGENLLRLRPYQVVERGIVRTFQLLGLFPYMTVLENLLVGEHRDFWANPLAVAFGLPGARRQERDRRAQALWLLRFLKMEPLADAFVFALPYGTQKLIELMRALLARPRLLLLDEPVAGMNAAEKAAMREFIERINRDWGITVLLVEHDMNFVMGLCDRIIVLSYGKIIAEGRADEIQQNPQVIEAYLGEGIGVARP
uniref:Branched-chain amino acid transport system ATP-binding protein n=1 Tax=Acetithermum autotrophicum TaxID=1446466 RepID=H5STU4_ACEAU|nr:branched-chain amino acid transport system ATP-binding protein [Candidatus Acetothermum autotrophicum]